MTGDLSVDAVFKLYEHIRPRLVTARFAGVPEHVRNLPEIADRFDAVLFDSFGVLNVGDRPIEGAVDSVAQLRAMGKRVIVLTNAASYCLEDAWHKYRRLGFDFAREEIVSSRAVAARHISQTDGIFAAICEEGDQLAEFDGKARRWSADCADDADGFLLLAGNALTQPNLAALEAALRQRPRPVLVANPDLVAPRETGLSREPGLVAHELIDRLGIEARFYGKPFGNAFDAALALLPGIARDRVVMVCDMLHTDILGGAAAGLRTVLVSDHGIMAGRDVGDYIKRSGIVPDHIVPGI